MLKSNVKLLKRPVGYVNTFPHSHENKIVRSQSVLECPLVTYKDTHYAMKTVIVNTILTLQCHKEDFTSL